MNKKVIIIGGVAGGASAAARLRRVNEQAEIILLERGEYISFANCGLPYHIGEVITEREELLLQTPQAMKDRFNIDVRVFNEATHIDRESKTLTIKNVQTGESYTESYDELILSTGSTPLKPPIPGIDAENIFSLWNVPDTDQIKAYVDEKKPSHAVVIGGGFIGIEMAENLVDRGIKVSLVEKADQVMTPIDKDMAELVHRELRKHGIELYLSNGVTKFESKGGFTEVHVENGTVLKADMVILSIGIRPQSELAKAAGLEINARGGVVVNDEMRTLDPHIYAIGDVIEVEEFVSKSRTMIPLAGPANKQGRIVANIISGIEDRYKGTQGTSIVKVFKQVVAGTGLNEKTLQRMGKVFKKDYHVALIHSNSHAGYYPGAESMVLKLLFDLQGKVLGAQIVGYEGVDKRIDVIATALRMGATIQDLKELELAYAPPFSSAKDPVNMVGFVAENILTGRMGYVTAAEFDAMDKTDAIILDVRGKGERKRGHIKGSVNIAVNDLRDNLHQLPKDKEIIIYCAVGLRGYIASRILLEHGYENVKNLSGGYTTYSLFNCDPETGCVKPVAISHVHVTESGELQG